MLSKPQNVPLRRVQQINDPSIELVSYPPLCKDWVQRFLKDNSQIQTQDSTSSITKRSLLPSLLSIFSPRRYPCPPEAVEEQ